MTFVSDEQDTESLHSVSPESDLNSSQVYNDSKSSLIQSEDLKRRPFTLQVLQSDTTIILPLVLTGILLVLGGIVGIRYLKRRYLRDARHSRPNGISQTGSVFEGPQPVVQQTREYIVENPANIIRNYNPSIQSSQYVQRNNEILLQHTIVIDSFPNPYASALRPNNNIERININQPIYNLPLEGNPNDPQTQNNENNVPKEELNPDVRCVICWEQEANMIFAPCAHKCCCTKDAWYIVQNNKTCPMCRNVIEGVINSTIQNPNSNPRAL